MARWGRRWLDDDEESVTKLTRWQSGVTARKMVAEDDEEDATIEEETEDGIGSRDRSASSDTKSDVKRHARKRDRHLEGRRDRRKC